MTIYDISRTISPDIAVWPGDSPYSYTQVLDIDSGSSVNLMTLTMSAHTGSHADAPFHYEREGEHPAKLDLSKYIGPAHVVSISRRQGGILPDDLDAHDLKGIERLLIHTWVSDLPDNEWPQDFPFPTLDLIDWLAAQGGVLLGVDVPSVDAFDSTNLECHHRLYHYGIANLEMLNLSGVPDGYYELVALPLKLDGVCGSPVRAVLRMLDNS
jgi:arylformamidase